VRVEPAKHANASHVRCSKLDWGDMSGRPFIFRGLLFILRDMDFAFYFAGHGFFPWSLRWCSGGLIIARESNSNIKGKPLTLEIHSRTIEIAMQRNPGQRNPCPAIWKAHPVI
jgi:hypothetical protein